MKVILSRKGFDSQYGGMPSPILPDGTLLSLQIPSKTDMETKYRDLYYGNSSYYDIIHTLSPNNKIKEEYNCHLDPDIRGAIKDRPTGWKPTFGRITTPAKTGDGNRRLVFILWLVQTNGVYCRTITL